MRRTIDGRFVFPSAMALAVSLLLTTELTQAEPATTAWVTDVSLPRAHAAETLVTYEHQLTDIKAQGEGIDRLGLGLRAGLASSLALTPAFVLGQRGEEPLRLEQMGFELRWRAPLSPFGSDEPAVMVYGGYANDLGEALDHLWRAAASARYEVASVYLNADLRSTLNLGGEQGTAFETWFGTAVGYGWQPSWMLRAGLELFAIVPVVGERLSDPTFGEAAESNSAYYGPSLAFSSSPFYAAASAVTGYPLSTPASQFMFRTLVGIQH